MANSLELEKRISTTNDAGLVAMLFERMVENFTSCISAINEKVYSRIYELNNNTRAILAELIVQFNGEDEISTSLRDIYIYINKLITEGEIKKDPSIFETCITIIRPICEAFQELEVREEPKAVTGLTYGKNSLNEHIIKGDKNFEG
ncbi:MAG: flagellar protein FliS [Tissierellia bacterium]|nr:flagellar protein FliS [Tissierellia bacterium]